MLFPTFKFLFFFLVVFYCSIFLRKYKRSYAGFLVIASFVFYSFFDIRFSLILAGSIILNYIVNFYLCKVQAPGTGGETEEPKIKTKAKTKAKAIFALGIVINLVTLGIFKYYNFFLSSILNVSKDVNIPEKFLNLNIIVPVGISFFTFRAISHLFDVYRGKLKMDIHATPTSFTNFALYISFFPQLTAGPISRANDFYEDLNNLETKNYLTYKTYLLVFSGLLKKVVIASYLYDITTKIFLTPANYSSLDLIIGVFAYAVMIFTDFSGYSDLSNAISNALGFRTIPNFDSPYKSSTISEFWSRWHISLSTWIRDYIYIPLGGNRKGFVRTCLNLLITMALAGLWHGASWVFVVWGVIHGIALVIDKVVERLVGKNFFKSGVRFCIGNIVTIIFVLFSWIFFASADLDTAALYIEKILSPETSNVIYFDFRLIAVIILVFSFNYFAVIFNKLGQIIFTKMPLLSRIAIGLVFIYILWLLMPDEVPPFIYYSF